MVWSFRTSPMCFFVCDVNFISDNWLGSTLNLIKNLSAISRTLQRFPIGDVDLNRPLAWKRLGSRGMNSYWLCTWNRTHWYKSFKSYLSPSLQGHKTCNREPYGAAENRKIEQGAKEISRGAKAKINREQREMKKETMKIALKEREAKIRGEQWGAGNRWSECMPLIVWLG